MGAWVLAHMRLRALTNSKGVRVIACFDPCLKLSECDKHIFSIQILQHEMLSGEISITLKCPKM